MAKAELAKPQNGSLGLFGEQNGSAAEAHALALARERKLPLPKKSDDDGLWTFFLMGAGFGLISFFAGRQSASRSAPSGPTFGPSPEPEPPPVPSDRTHTFTLSELRQLAAAAGFQDPVTAAAIAMAESSGRPWAVKDTRGRTDLPPHTSPELSIGLWQINVLVHPTFASWDLKDPAQNAHAALILAMSPNNWRHWSVYTTSDPTQSYKRFMPAV